MTAERFLLRDPNGRDAWMYLPIPEGASLQVGAIIPTPAAVRGWWQLPEAILPLEGRVAITHKPGRRKTHYTRTIEAGGYPETLTVEQYAEVTDPDAAVYDRRVAALYEPVHEPEEARVEVVEGPWLLLDGSPPENDEGLHWQARLPAPLRYSPEYLHLFPGQLVGFREHLAADLNEIACVQAHAFAGKPVSVYVKVLLPRLEPSEYQKRPELRVLTAAERRRRARLADGHETITRSLEFNVSDSVKGESLAEALAEWRSRRDEIVAYVRAIVARPCPACLGRGFTEDVGGLFPGLRDVLALALEASATLGFYNNTLDTSLSPSWRAEQILDRAVSKLSEITGGLDADVIDGILERTHPKEETHGTS